MQLLRTGIFEQRLRYRVALHGLWSLRNADDGVQQRAFHNGLSVSHDAPDAPDAHDAAHDLSVASDADDDEPIPHDAAHDVSSDDDAADSELSPRGAADELSAGRSAVDLELSSLDAYVRTDVDDAHVPERPTEPDHHSVDSGAGPYEPFYAAFDDSVVWLRQYYRDVSRNFDSRNSDDPHGTSGNTGSLAAEYKCRPPGSEP